MPTLNAMFRLVDGYSAQIDRFINKSDQASTRVLQASKNTDAFNDMLDETEQSAKGAASGLKVFAVAVAAVAGAKKVMDLTDAYTNTSARLSMVNDGLQTQAELQDKIFAAAERARGSYGDMASAVSKMNLLAGDSFGSNDEAIRFTELLQKSLKVSGAGQGEQDSAFLQLTQAMASGKLQGDEFRSVMENAPMVAQAIADYMGVTKGELKELSSDGAVTADIIKNALFGAADDINDKFSEMPMTFEGVWSSIKNAGQRAFGGVFEKLNGILNSESVQNALDNLIGAIYLAGDATEQFIDFCITAWPMVSPFIWAAVAALGMYVIALTVSNGLALISSIRFGVQAVGAGLFALAMWATTDATWAATTAELGLNSAMYACPLVWIIGIILVLVAVFYAAVAAINHFAGTTYSATGLICGAIAVVASVSLNMIIGLVNGIIGVGISLYNLLATFANFFANVFNDPVGAILNLFTGMFDFILEIVQEAAKLIDTVLKTDMSGAIEGFRKDISSTVDDIVGEQVVVMKKLDASDYQFDSIDYKDAWEVGNKFGEGLADTVSDLFSGFNDLDKGLGDDFATASNPATVEGPGKDGSMEVNMADEDIQYLRDLAQRDYIAKIATNTLAPNIRVEFSGPIAKEADAGAIRGIVEGMLRDEIATCAEGVY